MGFRSLVENCLLLTLLISDEEISVIHIGGYIYNFIRGMSYKNEYKKYLGN